MFKTKLITTVTITLIIIIGYILIHLPYLTHLDCTTNLHEWRQCDVLGVARNYYNESMNFFYPRIDGWRNLSGITGMEFPLFNYILALLYTISGKVISFGCSLGSLWLIFKITITENKDQQIKIFKDLEKKGAKFYFFEYDANYNNLKNKDYKTNIKFKMIPVKTYINKLQNNSIPKMYLAKP